MQHNHGTLHTTINNWKVRTALLALNLFVGLTAIVGGIAILLGAFQMPGEWLQNTPFSSYQIPGMILAVFVGGSALVAAVAVMVRSEWDALASLVAGVILAGWIVSEVVMIGLQSGLQPFYFAIGLLIIGLATLLLMTEWRRAS
ncbi:MAG TPA: hypothetical protein VKR42_09120 [Ktedonobacteraceae bacterium]|nr:hypothetical protein [Ktedonobacteraceae bacterium]